MPVSNSPDGGAKQPPSAISAHDAAVHFMNETRAGPTANQPDSVTIDLPRVVKRRLREAQRIDISVPSLLSGAAATEPVLPAAFYRERPADPDDGSARSIGLAIRTAFVVCLLAGAGGGLWFAGRSDKPVTVDLVSALVPPPPGLAGATHLVASDDVTTAQILAVAERFVATGDILAARAMLTGRASAGDPKAQFALAETFDPNMLSSWNVRGIDAKADYARLLYGSARRNGIAQAQARLDALP